jgi:hypothetical protein
MDGIPHRTPCKSQILEGDLTMNIKTLCVLLAMMALGYTPGFAQEAKDIVIDGNFEDWENIPVAIEDPQDMSKSNIHGDYKSIKVASTEETFFALETVYGQAAPVDNFRYYYHILIDADNKVSTGVKNDIYEDNPTGVKDVIGADFYVQIGRRNGADDGIIVVHLESQQEVFQDFPWESAGDSIELCVNFELFTAPAGFDIGAIFQPGQTIRVAAFQEGNADGWGPIDWTEPAEHVIGKPFAVEPENKAAVVWGALKAGL